LSEEQKETLKKQIKLVSEEKWNFLKPPSDTELKGFNFSLGDYFPVAQLCLETDSNLQKMRFYYVPYKVKEEKFWYNYFARIYVLKNTLFGEQLRSQEIVEKSIEKTPESVLPPKIDEKIDTAISTNNIPTTDSTDNEVVLDDSTVGLDEFEEELRAELEEFHTETERKNALDGNVDPNLNIVPPELLSVPNTEVDDMLNEINKAIGSKTDANKL